MEGGPHTETAWKKFVICAVMPALYLAGPPHSRNQKLRLSLNIRLKGEAAHGKASKSCPIARPDVL